MAVAHRGGLAADPEFDGATETTTLILIVTRHHCSPWAKSPDESYLGPPAEVENGCASGVHYRISERDPVPARRYSAGATPTQRLNARLNAASDP